MANNLLKDLKLSNRSFNRQVSDRTFVDLQTLGGRDLQTTEGRANLAQAIVNRLLTRKGELARLGHPGYGSRLYQILGEPDNNRIRGRAEIYIRECLAQESRIEEVTQVKFSKPSRGFDRGSLEVTIGVKPRGNEQEFTVIIPINL